MPIKVSCIFKILGFLGIRSMFNPDRNKCLSHNAEYKNKLTDDFFLLLAWISVFNSGHPHCKTCHSSDGNENNFRSAVQANSQSQYLHRIEVSRIFPSNLRKTNRFFIKDGLLPVTYWVQTFFREKISNIGNMKVGCVFLMIVVSILPSYVQS